MKHTLDWFLNNTQINGDCLEWTKCLNTDGYPRVAYKGNSNGKAHRIVYQLSTGNDPIGYVVMHTCDNPKCINPEHLVLGTHQSNIYDRSLKGRSGAAKLTPTQVRGIRSMAKEIPMKDIAQMFNVSYSTIQSIVARTHWKSII